MNSSQTKVDWVAEVDREHDGETETWTTSNNEDVNKLNSQKQHLSLKIGMVRGNLLDPIVAVMRMDGTAAAADDDDKLSWTVIQFDFLLSTLLHL